MTRTSHEKRIVLTGDDLFYTFEPIFEMKTGKKSDIKGILA
jgi:hypothetical protein